MRLRIAETGEQKKQTNKNDDRFLDGWSVQTIGCAGQAGPGKGRWAPHAVGHPTPTCAPKSGGERGNQEPWERGYPAREGGTGELPSLRYQKGWTSSICGRRWRQSWGTQPDAWSGGVPSASALPSLARPRFPSLPSAVAPSFPLPGRL